MLWFYDVIFAITLCTFLPKPFSFFVGCLNHSEIFLYLRIFIVAKKNTNHAWINNFCCFERVVFFFGLIRTTMTYSQRNNYFNVFFFSFSVVRSYSFFWVTFFPVVFVGCLFFWGPVIIFKLHLATFKPSLAWIVFFSGGNKQRVLKFLFRMIVLKPLPYLF